MALTGSLMTKYQGYTYKIDWFAAQDYASGLSMINTKHYLICDNTWGLQINSRTITCVLNSMTRTITTPSINTAGGSTILLGETNYDVPAREDGTVDFGLSSTFPVAAYISGNYLNDITVVGNGFLDTIPRTAKLTIPNIILGEDNILVVTKPVENFTYTITYFFYSLTGTIADHLSENQVLWNPDISEFAKQIPNTNSGNGTIVITTYLQDVKIGSEKYSFTCILPDSFIPTISELQLTPQLINGHTNLIYNYNKLNLKLVDAKPSVGSTIQSYTFTGPDVAITTNQTDVVVGPVKNKGELTYSVLITDMRGRTATVSNTIQCYEYQMPTFKQFAAALSNGIITCDYKVDAQQTEETRIFSINIYYKKGNGAYVLAKEHLSELSGQGIEILTNAEDTTYTLYATVEDEYGISISSDVDTVFGSTHIVNITRDGTGVAVGKKAESNNLFESRWDIKTNGVLLTDKPVETLQRLTVRDSSNISDDTVEYWANKGNLSTFYFDNNLATLISQPTDRGILVNLVANQNNVHHIWLSQSDNSVYHRRGTQDGFSAWLPFTIGTV